MTVKMSEEMAESRERKISSIINEYGSRLFRFVRGRVPSNADAEDITQEVWYQLSRVLEIDSIEQVSGWIFRVAKNRITDNFRKQKPDLLEDKNLENDNGSFNFTEILMAETTSPEDENLKELFWEALFKALDELPENQRNVFVWNELEDETFQEIADRTGENIKTLISRKRYAVQHLRVKLEELYGEFFDKN
ncbi:MAG: RNA polymerase sigma factor (sigma-70 family) [Algoriphagus sp.]|jgi:RNA polymerase sigma factor (sigma-70 family)